MNAAVARDCPVFPAYAGVSRPAVASNIRSSGLPRLRGGEPWADFAVLSTWGSSPPTRG